MTMKAVIYTSPREFSIQEVPIPEVGPNDVLIRVIQSGVCGTDVHIHNGKFFAQFPLTPGHEVVGTVAAMGNNVNGFTIGEQVSMNPNDSCGHCGHCRQGQPLHCDNLKGYGTNWPGSAAEYMLSPAKLTYSTEGLPLDVAVLSEPASCANHGLESLAVQPGGTVLVVGAGPTGILLAQMIVHGGASHVTISGSTKFKLDLATSYGIDSAYLMDRSKPDESFADLHALAPGHGGWDYIVDATGSADVTERCLPLLRTGGTLLVYGVTDPDDRVSFSPYDVFRRELSIKGSFAEISNFRSTIAMLKSGRVQTRGLITHRFGLNEYEAALRAVSTDRTAHKVVLVPW